MRKRRKELEVKIVPCFYDTKRAELLIVRYGWFGNPKFVRSFGFIYLSSKESEKKMDYVCELIDRFNRIQSLNCYGRKVMYDVRSALMTGEIKEVKKWETTTFRGLEYIIPEGEREMAKIGRDVFFTKEEAKKAINATVDKRVQYLENQIERIKSYKFE